MNAQAAPVPGAAPTRNAKLLKWVAEVAALTQPDSIYWCDGTSTCPAATSGRASRP